MARPLKTGLDYFPHDTDAVNDGKLQSLMALYGAEGYAFYFIMLERIFRTENGRITLGIQAEKAGLAKIMSISLKKFETILSTALEVKCFDPDIFRTENILTSSGIQKRINAVNHLREKERTRKENTKDKYKKKYKYKAKNGKPTENPTENPNPIEIKHKYGEYKHVFLTENEYKKLQERFNGNAEKWIKTLDEGIQQKGYKYKDHYLTILKWAERDNQKNTTGERLADRYKQL